MAIPQRKCPQGLSELGQPAVNRSFWAKRMLMLMEVQGMLSLFFLDAHQSLQEVNHQLESRMREIRQSGSEGGGAKQSSLPTPIV